MAIKYDQDSEWLSLYDLVAEQAERAPHAVAIRSEGTSLSYAALCDRANRVARGLIARGVAPDTVVPIYLERSPLTVIAILGVVAAGGCFLVLDPDAPDGRTRQMIRDTEPLLVLTSVARRAEFPEHDSCDVICLDDQSEAGISFAPFDGKRISPEERRGALRPGNLSFVIYTSGSTGAPKGSGNTQRAIVNCLQWLTDAMGLSDRDRVLHQTSPLFDGAILEIFLPLINGGAVVIAQSGEQADPIAIADLIETEAVSLAVFVPTTLANFLAAIGTNCFPSLRNILAIGEILTGNLQAYCHERLTTTTLWNGYGPSEAAVLVTLWRCKRDDGDAFPPIGWPCRQTGLLILNENLTPVEPGQPGELYIAGAPVSRGYLARPELTAERFLPAPHPHQGHMYRTGDIVRLREDGALEYRGRVDRQIKLNGVRMELEEIEGAISRLPSVSRVAVTVRDVSGRDRLVAYVIAQKDSAQVDAATLRSALSEWLLPSMIPSEFVFLEDFPLSVGGKLAVDQLPFPGPDATAPAALRSDAVGLLPRSDAERELAQIWCEVLDLDVVGVRESFFELGGDSILAIRVVRRAQQAGFAITVRTLFARDTIEALADLRTGIAGEIRAVAASQAATLRDPGSPVHGDERRSPVSAGKDEARPPTRSGVEDSFPLSAVQQGMLFHSLLAPGSGDYVEQVTGVIEHDDLAWVEQIWVRVLSRHAALRVSVEIGADEPAALVHAAIREDVRRLDWSDLDETARRSALALLLGRDRREDFDPLQPPLWRLYFAREGPERIRFIWSYHHLLLDGWSLTLILNEVSRALQVAAEGGASIAPSATQPPSRYADWLSLQDMAAALAFWEQELDGVRDGTGLGLPVPASVEGRRGRGRVTDRIARGRIDRFCRTERVTTATVLAGAVALLLSRYSSHSTVVFGIAASGRAIDLDDVESIVGNLLHLVPMRVDAAGGIPVGTWLRSLQAQHVLTQEFGYVPLTDLQREAAAADGHELIRVLVNFEEYHLDDGKGALHDVEILDAAHVPLVASFSADASCLRLRLVYDRSLFSDEAVAQVSRHLVRLIQEITADPTRPLEALEMLSSEEKRQVVEEFNDTAAPTGTLPIHDLIGRAPPEKVALVDGGEEITYAELNAQANRLANALRSLGAGRDVPVALCMERSRHLVAAMVGVLRAGAAYVPLDPEHPGARLDFMLRDATIAIAVVDDAGRSALAGVIAPNSAAPVILDLNADAAIIASQPSESPEVISELDDLAYILYTSGSTGQPKAVAQTHRTIVNMFDWAVGNFGLDPLDRWLFKTPATFDVSVPDVFFPLGFGGVVVVAPPGAQADPAALIDLITEQRISVVQFVPSMLGAFLDDPRAAECRSLRLVLAAGEKLQRRTAERCRTVLPAARLHNLYGPTETFYATDHRCDDRDPHDPPIGRPIANTRAYVLDHRGRPVPIGATGELWIGGAGVARGYLHNDQLTSERFRDDPFRSSAGERIYLTGDLARWRPDGELDYLGRSDDQVKVNGVRVELGEVESAIAEHPDVAQAAVAVRAGPGGGQRLVGYVVACGPNSPDHGAIAVAMRNRLPRAYVPTVWVDLEALPTTRNGKLDRDALPAPPDRTRGIEISRPTPLEAELCELWSAVLDGRSVGNHDDIFAAGADSLSCVRLVGKAKSQGINLDVKTIVAQPTPAGQASVILKRQTSDSQGAGNPALPMLFMFPGLPGFGSQIALSRLCVACSDLFDATIVEYPDWTTICQQQLEIDTLAVNFADRITRQLSAVAPGTPVLLAGYSLGGCVAYAVGLQLIRMGQPIAYLGILDSEPPSPTARWLYSSEANRRTTQRFGRHIRKLGRLSKLWDVDWLGYKVAHAAPAYLRFAPTFARLLPARFRGRLGNRINSRIMAPVTLRWLREPIRMSEHVDVPIALFRCYTSDETQAWAARTDWLDSVVVEGDHASMLKGENLISLTETFRLSVVTALSGG